MVSVVSKNITAGKNVIAVTGRLMAGHGSFGGGVGCGSGEAHSVSDTKFQKSMSCHMGLVSVCQNCRKRAQNRRFWAKTGILGRFCDFSSDIH